MTLFSFNYLQKLQNEYILILGDIMDRVAIDLGGIQIYWYSITMLCGVIFGGLITYFELKRTKQDTKFFLDMIFYVITRLP